MSEDGYTRRQRLGLPLGPALFVVVRWVVTPGGLDPAAATVLASTLWIATWWMTEAVPIPVTSLLPIVLFPTLGVSTVTAAAAPYADPVVFLFLGGFLLALAIERWDLHRRIALTVLLRAGDDPRRLLGAFMAVTAFLSMWLSNTATAMMMVPIGMAVVGHLEGPAPEPAPETLEAGTANPPRLGAALMLGIAYAASIGGVATLIGTPPNAILAGVARTSLGVQIGFLEWMTFGLPIAIAFLVVTWVVLLVVLRPSVRSLPAGRAVVREELDALGPMGRGERRVLAVFGLVVLGWVLRPFVLEPLVPGVTDAVIAIAGGILVFLVPVDRRRGEFLLDWSATTRVPWGVLVLFGGGFSLAAAVQSSGLDRWIAGHLGGLAGVPPAAIVLAVAALIVLLTEVTSNSATASLFVPVMAGLAPALGAAPLVLMVTVAVAASLAFMLPVATPPNAIVFGSGAVSTPQMARTGVWLNLLGIAMLSAAVLLWLPVAWGI